MNASAVLQSVNKLIGAVVGGGVIALLVGLHVIPAGVGNTLLTILGVAGAAIGLYLAPSNKPFNTDPGIPDDEVFGAIPPVVVEKAVIDEDAERLLSGGTAVTADEHVAEHAAPEA